jgi:hypothetical protein
MTGWNKPQNQNQNQNQGFTESNPFAGGYQNPYGGNQQQPLNFPSNPF